MTYRCPGCAAEFARLIELRAHSTFVPAASIAVCDLVCNPSYFVHRRALNGSRYAVGGCCESGSCTCESDQLAG